MDYQESRAYIKEAEKYGRVLGLENMQRLMERLGNPQNDLKFVHVGGTNGKGSVIAYLYTVLGNAGYRVGRYNSPTLYSYRERMECAGKRVSREKFAQYLTQTARVIKEMTAEGLPHPTPFEIETAVAFLFFKDENCDVVLLEVGLGGDLDATNIVSTTILSVFVSISMDHMDYLGDSLESIARHKAGIIKQNSAVVSTGQHPEVMNVLKAACREKNCSCTVADASAAEVTQESCFEQTFTYQGESYHIHLAGVYQKENAVLALSALEFLNDAGYPTTVSQRAEGLSKTHWNGRFTTLCRSPLFVVDGAHNARAAKMMADSIEHYFKDKKIYYIMGMFRDKDYECVLSTTAPYAKKIITIQTPDNPRALSAEELAAEARRFHPDVEAAGSIADGVERVFSLAEKDDVIIAFGSLSFIGELTEIVKEREEHTND